MAAAVLKHLPKSTQREILDDLNYCNLHEVRAFCRRHAVPFAIYVELPAATCFPARVVAPDELPAEPGAADRLFYGWYDKHNPALIGLLFRLTNGRYRNGAIARILMREFWTAGTAPTFAEFAAAWLRAEAKGLGIRDGEHPEAAWLTDRARGEAGPDWRAKRTRIATRVLERLDRLPPPRLL